MNIMDIPFKENEKEFIDLQNLFNQIGQEALFMTHY